METRLNLHRLGRHSIDFAALRLDADRTRHSLRHGGSEILQKVHAGTRILDQDRGRAMFRSETDDLAAQFRMAWLIAEHAQCKTIIIGGRPSMEGWTAAYHAAGIRPRGGVSDGAAARMSP